MINAHPPLKVSQCDLSELVRGCLAQFPQDHVERIAPLEAPQVIGYWDPSALQTALRNLLQLALTHSETPPPIRVIFAPEEETVAVAVHYSGSPAPHDQLILIKSPVEAHGGSLAAHLDSDRATYAIRLPLDSRT